MAYEWNAEEYREASGQQKAWGRELLHKLDFQGGDRILDIGCGDGMLTAEIAALVPSGSVVGIDSSSEMIQLARTSYPHNHYRNLSWELKDAGVLDYDEEFDVVFSNAVLHWVTEHQIVIDGIARALKTGGKALLQMGGRGNAAGVSESLIAVLTDENWSDYFVDFHFPYRFHGPEEYRMMLEQAGLECLRVELINMDMAQDGREGFASWIRTTWQPFTERIPVDLRERFILEIVDNYLERHPADPQGRVHAGMVRLEVEVLKPVVTIG